MYSQRLIRFHFIFHVVILAIPASMEVNRGQNGIQQLLAAELSKLLMLLEMVTGIFYCLCFGNCYIMFWQ